MDLPPAETGMAGFPAGRRGTVRLVGPLIALDGPLLADLAGLDAAAYRRRSAGTAQQRTGRDRFVRDGLIAPGDSGDPAAVAAIAPWLDDPAAASHADPGVVG